MKPLRIGDVSISKVIELDRSATLIGFMLPDSTPERIAAQRDWLGPELVDPATGNHRSTIHSYVVRTPWHTVLIDTCVGNDKPRNGVAPWHMRQGSYLADLAAAGVKPEDVDLWCAPTSTSTTWDGTPGLSVGGGCRRFPVPRTFSREMNTSSGRQRAKWGGRSSA